MRSAGIAGGVITGGYNTEYGGGIYVIGDGACLDLRGGTVYNNHAAYGGGIYVAASNSTSSGNDSATLYIVGGAVRNNIADERGGGVAMCIVARQKAEIWLSGASEITGNRAKVGGGIYALEGTLEGSSMGSTVIANNVATEKGGGIYYGSGYMLLNDGGTIEGNTAALGGGIYSAGSSGQTKNVIIRGNTATDLGGGVYVADGSLSIGGSNGIVGNHADNAGGGVYMEGGKLSAGCADGIHGNDAGANGGGAYVMGGEFTPQYSIADNTLSDGTLNNVYLPQDQLIAQKYSATGAKIGVTTEVLPTRDAPVSVASGSYANASYYVSDIEGYGFYRDAATSTVMMTPAYTVNVQETEHGAVTVNKNFAVPGNAVTVTIAPEEGYRLREGGVTLTCEGEDGPATTLEYEVIDETRFRFVMPDAPVTVAVEFEPLPHEHEWGEAVYTWAEDYASVTATRVCLQDETHVETETVAATGTVSLPATCETVGETTYTSAAFENTAFEAQTLTLADIPALSHDWGEATYTWSEDYASVTAARACLRDETHVETETVAATSAVSLPATCETVGETTYTSAAFENTAFEAQTLTLANIPALGHDWGEATYTWSEDNTSVTATRVCLRDETHVETETMQAAMALAEPPTETEAGQTAWSVTFQNPAFEAQSKVEADIPPLCDMNVLYLPEGLKTIGEGAFEGLDCQAVIVPEGCETIAPGAFAGCEELIYIRLANSLVEVAADAFEGCDLARIDRPGDNS